MWKIFTSSCLQSTRFLGYLFIKQIFCFHGDSATHHCLLFSSGCNVPLSRQSLFLLRRKSHPCREERGRGVLSPTLCYRLCGVNCTSCVQPLRGFDYICTWLHSWHILVANHTRAATTQWHHGIGYRDGTPDGVLCGDCVATVIINSRFRTQNEIMRMLYKETVTLRLYRSLAILYC